MKKRKEKKRERNENLTASTHRMVSRQIAWGKKRGRTLEFFERIDGWP